MKPKLYSVTSVIFGLAVFVTVCISGCGLLWDFGEDPLTIPCGPGAPCPGNDRHCWKTACMPICNTSTPCPTQDDNGNPASLVCLEGKCYPTDDHPDIDAGTASDAGDAGDSGKSAICGESCTPVPDGWSSMLAVWIGPSEKAPFYSTFHGEKTLPRFTGRADLDAGPAECDACSCSESTGKCTDLPSSIEVHTAMCGQASSSLFFGGPTDWDGSCTNANSITAGQKCPAGSSTLCAQSVSVAPLGAPVDESCTPFTDKLPVAKARLSGPVWETAAVGYDVPGCNTNESCMPSIDLPSGFRSCIYQRGEHECPSTWTGDRHVVYEVTADKPGIIDARDCSPCSCGAPVGSGCTAHLRTFENAGCSKLIADVPISSFFGSQCTNITPGIAIGSKEITSPLYLAGMCEPLGGEPIGAAIPDANQAVTFCCSAQDA